jgi:stearoyl-CoA desaturase (delta-9 desaturase)
MFGRIRYKTTDTSRNSLLLALITLGEGWHNNHHYYATSTNMGFFWWEIDVSYYVLRVLSFFGLIWDIKKPPQRVLEAARS